MKRDAGFTLLEVLLTMGVLAVITLSIATGIGTGHTASRRLEREVVLLSRAQEMLEQLRAIPFGSATDPAATAGELTEFFDEDGDYGSVTLKKIEAFGTPQFENAGFPVPGLWRVIIDADLNGDGDVTDADEGRADLVRILILHEGRLLARSVRYGG